MDLAKWVRKLPFFPYFRNIFNGLEINYVKTNNFDVN
jgi:hypothetical protein